MKVSQYYRVLYRLFIAICSCEFALGCSADQLAEPKDLPNNIVPWIEVNNSKQRAIDHAVEGLLIWQKITDTAIVSTAPGHEKIYREFQVRVPGMRIIPGMKTHTLLDQFDSIEGWRNIAKHVETALLESGEKEIVMENETAIRLYRRGESQIDLKRFRQCIELLPKNISYIWYPGVQGHKENVQKRYEEVCKIVASILDVRFTNRSIYGPSAIDELPLKKAQERIRLLSKRESIPLIYCIAKHPWWTDQQVPHALSLVPGEWAILYPGTKRWVESARSISALLPARTQSSN